MTKIMLRIPDGDGVKIRTIAAAHNLSMNAFITTLIRREIRDWESKYGELPNLVTEEEEESD